MTDNLATRLSQCGKEFAATTVPALTTPTGVNIPSLIAGCARMAGTYMFRSFGLAVENLEPGAIVMSIEASQSSALLETCAAILAELGTTIASSPKGVLVEERNKPRLAFLETQRLLEPHFQPIREHHALNDQQAAHAAAIAAGILIHTFAQHFEPDAGFGIAALSFTEGTRTVPSPFG